MRCLSAQKSSSASGPSGTSSNGIRLAGWMLLVLPGVCGAGPAAGEPARIRLIERLDSATIHSPLLTAAGWQAEQARHSVVFEEDFERFDKRRANWPSDAGCRTVERKPGGKALAYEGGGGHKCHFVLAARPSTWYRIRRAVKTDDPLVDLRVLESRVGVRHPEVLNHPQDIGRARGGKFIKASRLLFIHRFPAPRSNDTWATDDLFVFTRPQTRSLVLLVHDAESAVGHTERNARFDDLLVERLAPTGIQQHALLKLLYPAGEADPARGIAKHGQFLPVGDVARVTPPRDANHDYRDGLFAPAPTDLVFPIRVPTAGRLFVSCGLLKTSRPGDEATFRVKLAPEQGKSRILLEQTLHARADGKGWHWHDHRIDLSPWAGQPVRLSFQTRAPTGSRGHAVWGSPVVERPRRSGDPPPVILIAVDTLRADRLSCYGHDRTTSPHIDRLAADGVRFSRVIANSNWTTPSFASMFTGLPPSRHQVVHRASAIPPTCTTLAERLQENGWSTRGIAYKTYLYNMGFDQGFDVWFNLPRIQVRADDNLAKALAWLAGHHDRRFFLFLHFNDPHQPFNQPPPFDRSYNRLSDLERFGLKLPIVIGPHKGIVGCKPCLRAGKPVAAFRRLASDLYDGEVAYLDDRLGRFFDALRHHGLYRKAMIAFVSDHGELIYEKGDFFGHGSSRLCDELVWVPMIIKPPAESPVVRGKVIDAQVRVHDLMPTLLEMAGAPVEGLEIDGRSLVPLLCDAADDDRPAVSENVKHHALAIRRGPWMYELDYRPRRPVTERLFRGRPYPSRGCNLADKHPAQLRAFRLLTMEYFLEHRSGHHLLVTGDGDKRSVRIRLRSEQPLHGVRPLFGLPRTGGKGKRSFVFSGVTDNPVLLYARLPAGARGALAVEVHPEGPGARRLNRTLELGERGTRVRGTLEPLLAGDNVGVHLIEGPPRLRRPGRQTIVPDGSGALRSSGQKEKAGGG